VRDRNRPAAGDHGPEMKDGLDQQQPSSTEIATSKQDSRRDPITVIINGAPVAKARPRFVRKTGIAFTPSHVRKYEAHGRLAASAAMDGRPPIEVPVRIELLVELPVPASWSKRKAADAITGHIRPTSRPDTDNYIKSAFDAISGIVIGDDSQVVEIHAEKKFGIAPKMVATIFPLNAASSNRRAPS
jgi:Holliday junction resolvase RusA-like endonuclease